MNYPTVTLNSGYTMPLLGIGSWQSAPNETYSIMKEAIKMGYRHIDTAQGYCNEREIGKALQECIVEGIVKREDIFITTKIWSNYLDPKYVRKACEESLKRLQVDYIDLYLIHNPFKFEYNKLPEDIQNSDDFYDCSKTLQYGMHSVGYNSIEISNVWKCMEELVKDGLCHSIGISNFSTKKIEELLKTAKIIPAMNQIEYNIPQQQPTVSNYCLSKGIHITSFTPFGRPISDNSGKMIPLKDHTIANIGKKYNKSNAQVIIRWLIQKQIVAIPKTVTLSRLHENFNVLDFTLSDEDMNILNNMNRNDRSFNGLFFATPDQDWKDIWDYEDVTY